MLDPEIVLMDEPSEGLAPIMVQAPEKMIAQLRLQGLGILLVEQNLYSVLARADRIYLIETGRIVHQGSRAEVEADASPLQRYLGTR